MPEYIEVDQMWKCDTCFHNQSRGCTLGAFGCDHGESYRPAYSKLKKADVAPVVRCKDCKHYHSETGYCDKNSYFVDGDGMSCSPAESPNWTMFEPDDFCSYGERKDGGGK